MTFQIKLVGKIGHFDHVFKSIYTCDYENCRDLSKKPWKHLCFLSQRSHCITCHSQEVNNTSCLFHIFITDRSPSRKLNLDSLSDELCKHLLHFHLSKTAKLTYFYREHIKEHKAMIVHVSKGSICLHDLFFHWLHVELTVCWGR